MTGAKPSPPPATDAAADAESFAIFMAGVRTLDGRATRIPASASGVERSPRGTGPAADPDAGARANLRSLVAEGVRFEVSDDGRHLEGRRIDLDPRELRRLRRGEHAVDGRLDLHGLSVSEARDALEAFVRKRRAEGDRVVEVIHGKGNHSPRGISVLRGEIAAWLSQGKAARHVSAFTSLPTSEGAPRDRDEGAGALVVLLAR